MPKPFQNKLFDIEIMHSVGLKRLEISNAKKVSKFLEQVEEDVFKKASNSEFYQGRITREKRRQLNKTIKRVQKDIAINDRWTFRRLRKQMENLAEYEYAFQTRAVKAAAPFPVGVVSAEQSILLTSVFTEPFQGSPLNEWTRFYSQRKQQKITQAMRQSFYQGEGQAGAARRLLGGPGQPGIINASRREAEALARTALNHSANQARNLFQKNNPVGTKYRYTAVLDGRTTIICGSRDGEIYKSNERPVLPAHINCRSIYVSIVDPDVILGERQTITSTSTRKKIMREWRATARQKAGDKWKTLNAKQRNVLIKTEKNQWVASNIGTVPAKTTFQQWLRSQNAGFQDQFLGKTRGALFRRGKLKLNDFLDKTTARPINLDKLRVLEKKAFNLANL